MATLKQTIIEGDFLAEDKVIDLNEAIGGAQDPDSFFSAGGIRIKRGTDTPAIAVWNETDDQWEVGLEGATERVLTESDKGSITAEADLEEGTNISLSANASTGATVIDAVASGSGGEVQFNSGGLFAADSDLVFDAGTSRLTASGGLDIANESTVRIGGQDALYLDWNAGNEGLALGPSAEEHVRSSAQTGNIFVRAEGEGGPYSLAGQGNVVIGDFTSTAINTQGHVIIGHRATQGATIDTGPDSVSVGFEAGRGASGFNRTTFVGAHAGQGASGSNASRESVAIGRNALRDSDTQRTVAVGNNAGRSASGTRRSVFVGLEAGTSQGDYTQASADRGIALGSEAFTTAAGQFVVGAPSDKGTGDGAVTDAYLGKGVEATDPAEVTIHGTNAQVIQDTKNASKAGADVTVATGKGSGDAAGAGFRVKTAEPETADYAEQSLVERLRVDATGLYITQAPTTTSNTGELLSRDPGTGQVQSIAPTDLTTEETYRATTTGDETKVVVSGGSPAYDAGTAVNFEIHVAAQVSSVVSASLTDATEGDTHTFEVEGSAVNRGSGVELVGAPDVNSVSYDVPVSGLEVGLATSGQDLQIQVTGVPDVTVEWAAEVLDTEIDLQG